MNYSRIIPLTKGQVTIVDSSDYEYLMQFSWAARWTPKGQCFYACRGKKRIGMHRIIMGLEDGDKRLVDHINGNTLDNQSSRGYACPKSSQ